MRKSVTLLPGATFDLERLSTPADAAATYRSAVALATLGSERVALEDAGGRFLAVDVVADDDYPNHRRSTMDGFALATGGGREFVVTGEIRMGFAPPRSLGAGEAMRIPTGGALPEGADAVVPIEDVDERDDPGGASAIVLHETVQAGENFTPIAADMRRGECVLAAGRRVGAPELGVLATLGMTSVPVYVQPRVAIVSTGDELVDPDVVPAVGQVRDSNRYALAGALRALGAVPVHVPRAGDTEEALRAALVYALANADAVLLSGGSSVGTRDLTPDIVDALGDPGVVVHGLRVKPGKPTVLAAVGSTPIFGLPGNPASSLMIFEAIVAPFLRTLCGSSASVPRRLGAVAAETFRGRPGWTWYVPARLECRDHVLRATPIPIRSSLTTLLSRASGYVVVGEDAVPVAAGERVEVVPFSCGGA